MEELITIEFERTGGFAGIPVRVILNGNLLDAEEVTLVKQLVESSGFFLLSSRDLKAAAGNDQFQYRIAIATTRQKHEVVLDEQQVPEKLKPLIRFLSGRVRTRKK